MFKPTPNAWLKHDIAGHGWVAPDASIANCGFKDQLFTMICWPSGRRLPALASACEAAAPPGKPRLAYARDEVQAPCDSERV